jgi:hypothetical protein
MVKVIGAATVLLDRMGVPDTVAHWRTEMLHCADPPQPCFIDDGELLERGRLIAFRATGASRLLDLHIVYSASVRI